MGLKIKYSALLCALFIHQLAAAQGVEMADAMRSNGKIYVVVLIVAIVFAGILAYLIYIDRKLRNLEKKLEK